MVNVTINMAYMSWILWVIESNISNYTINMREKKNSIPDAHHGAGRFTYIETPSKSRSDVGKYTSTMLRIWV